MYCVYYIMYIVATKLLYILQFRAAESESESPESEVFGGEESESDFLKIEECGVGLLKIEESESEFFLLELI